MATLIFNLSAILHGEFGSDEFAALLGGLTAVITIVGIIVMFVTPRRSFILANQMGISRTSLWLTDILTPVFWTLVNGIVTGGLALMANGSAMKQPLWLGLILYLGWFFSVQTLANCVALVHGIWKVVLAIGIPSLLLALLIWLLTILANHVTFSHAQAIQLVHKLNSPGLWIVIIFAMIVVLSLLSLLFTRLIRLQRD